MAALTANGGVILSVQVDAGSASTLPRHADGNVDLALTVSGTAESFVVFTADATLPSLTAVGSLFNYPPATLDATLPVLTATGTMVAGESGRLNKSLPKLTAYGIMNPGARVTLPRLTLSGDVVSGSISTLSRSLPSLALSGAFDNAATATLDRNIPRLTSAGYIAAGTVSTSDRTLANIRISATLAAGGLGTASLTLPFLTTSFEQTSEGIAEAGLTLPRLYVTAFMDNGTTLSTTVWSLNTETFDVSNYVNYGFIGFCKIGSNYYGVKTDGIYLLEGSTDAGSNIVAVFLSGDDDFGTEHNKRMDKAYVGYEADGDIVLTANGKEYPLQREIATSGIKNSRVSLAKGIKSRYWNLGIKNVEGSDFHINELGILPRVLERKT
ncbi:MAG: hypothetical protein WD355_02270 [Balneolaceae bacterium]